MNGNKAYESKRDIKARLIDELNLQNISASIYKKICAQTRFIQDLNHMHIKSMIMNKSHTSNTQYPNQFLLKESLKSEHIMIITHGY